MKTKKMVRARTAPAERPAFLAELVASWKAPRPAPTAAEARLFATPANDSLDSIEFLDPAFVAPALPEVREISCPTPDEMPPPADARRVVDVIRAGWCTTAKTLSYGLMRGGVRATRVQAVIAEAMRSGLIRCERGVWRVSELASLPGED